MSIKNSRIRVFNKKAKKYIFGACAVGVGVGGFIGTYKTAEYFATRPKYDLDDLPLIENNYGRKYFSENKNPNVVLTINFEDELKKGTKEEQQLVVNGLKYAIDQFNSLTNYYNYTLTAETDYFKKFGIEKNTSDNIIPFTLTDIEEAGILAQTHLDAKLNGEITNASIEFDKSNLYYIWASYKDDERTMQGDNSFFSTIVQHELAHTTGMVDIYDKNLRGETLMFYQLTYNTPTYTSYDREVYLKFEERLTGKTATIENANLLYNTSNNQYALTKVYSEDEIEK